MNKICCIRCAKYIKLKQSKILYILSKVLVFSTFCERCSSNNDEIFKEEESVEIFIILGCINNINK